MVVSLSGRQNVKMVPFDVVTSCFNVISNSRKVIMFRKDSEMLLFPVVKSSFRFPNVRIVAVPATSFIKKYMTLNNSHRYHAGEK